MKLAIPLAQGRLSPHFGHCEQFAIFEVDTDSGQVISHRDIVPPAHEPGVLPLWLSSLGVNVIIAGGMGKRAQQLFAQNEIEVAVGAPTQEPGDLVSAYVNGTLQCGENVCDH
jgi:predicted Fe-Mo cluster-binding NifX family protein